jgi:glycine cleavage system H protein
MTVLLFISTIIIFLTIDHFVRRSKSVAAAAQPVIRKAIPFRTPAGIFFTKSHTWLSLFPSGKVQLGIDDFIARMFNTPSITLLKNDREQVKRGEAILKMREGKNEITVRSPINGTVEHVNSQLVKHPELMNENLFSEGWAYTITPARTDDLRTFYLGSETRTWLRDETGKLRDFFAHMGSTPDMVPVMLQDGGIPANGVMNKMNPDQCRNFENQFLSVE